MGIIAALGRVPDPTEFEGTHAEFVDGIHAEDEDREFGAGFADFAVLAESNSSASSSVSTRWTASRTSTSEVEERMFVRCFSLHALTSRSSAREFSPTIRPS